MPAYAYSHVSEHARYPPWDRGDLEASQCEISKHRSTRSSCLKGRVLTQTRPTPLDGEAGTLAQAQSVWIGWKDSSKQQTPSSEYKYGESSAFTDFIKAQAQRTRVGSLDTSMRAPAQVVQAPELAMPQTENTTNMQRPMTEPTAQQFVPLPSFGIKVPKPRDLDWPVFMKFTRKEVYPGLGADFKTWGLRFLQRLAAAQQMSGGD
ncbi:uncharacterized protein PITG_06745 [Phytophthora infestans T30-4]|uniref:Uncharacterized protein n=1 Tax=Phytophthora infestans (strain T30-4) TaxID=403677 RepID=D0N804_PHYIT|nr:uncharacterized protein PITG_06745 [Phytophthora infestans T30-4]EEY53121.1 conserved hypothetical protein [Phytophthora infestans T30-4]|eukprot:XP_002904739.1 conserved hypothetical protein [Phytophthora infestans T30-4]